MVSECTTTKIPEIVDRRLRAHFHPGRRLSGKKPGIPISVAEPISHTKGNGTLLSQHAACVGLPVTETLRRLVYWHMYDIASTKTIEAAISQSEHRMRIHHGASKVPSVLICKV